ncbi:hypothetical protein PN419_05595 [Halorubrum ezzemoulense]|jgi:hypothetical protein|uniref:Uncharacterized protein n=1 Tax=Halorubrum ezzemoulense TaxID=337243 RepID=A0A238WDJ6_HALEZ|nr:MULTISPECIES: hypothetical protein [Halorubrum]MDB2224051.1 hypothetical protein [Halorubrum ezzemoulense]MDB2240425.1 hypothetical protein [Halorubrum ezzemoulense]MDB2243700.1 hypothetical protein [Halorubrum ezzemoulense]MDB2251766.1 hypothetical protein [Halorubrum ezzemoulense]MDB2264107.1 hypothetical protein [Halorubrum ezzemoulense]
MPPGGRRTRLVRALAALSLAAPAVFLVGRAVGFWRVRLAVGKLLALLPDDGAPDHVRVLPPPADEYAGTLQTTPAETREQLPEQGFSELIRAYFHAYDRDGEAVHEVGSFVHRPEGLTGDWQVHVRLFPAPDGATEVWAHWERNPYVAPLAHLRMEGYDPARGQRMAAELIDDLRCARDDGAA